MNSSRISRMRLSTTRSIHYSPGASVPHTFARSAPALRWFSRLCAYWKKFLLGPQDPGQFYCFPREVYSRSGTALRLEHKQWASARTESRLKRRIEHHNAQDKRQGLGHDVYCADRLEIENTFTTDLHRARENTISGRKIVKEISGSNLIGLDSN